jgi:hypothetical protein
MPYRSGDPPSGVSVFRKIIGRLIFFPGTIIVFIAAIKLGYRVIERIAVESRYSEAAYQSGLRLLTRPHLHFSNGAPRPRWVTPLLILLVPLGDLLIALVWTIAVFVTGVDFLGVPGLDRIHKWRAADGKQEPPTFTLPERFRHLANDLDVPDQPMRGPPPAK